MIFNSPFKNVLLTLIISLLLLVVFYSNVLFNLNNVYFSRGGDGLQSYTNTLYHIAYDTSYMHQTNMNYPYGENVFFTNCQFPVANTIKFFKNVGLDFSSYTIGILNAMMIFSIPLCALFLYLIFFRLSLPPWYSIIAAIGIAFLSPQIYRFPGHFTLGYMFALPLVIYLLLRVYQTSKVNYSIYIGVFATLISLFHIYYLGLIGATVLGFWFFLFVLSKEFRRISTILLHLSIQLIIPFIIIKLWGASVDTFANRTNNPWGYLFYVSFWEGIFLPLNTPLERFFAKIFWIDKKEFEGIAYVGLVAFAAFIIIPLLTAWKVMKSKKLIKVAEPTDNTFLNALLGTALVALVFSMGYPFVGKFQNLFHYSGFIKQLRAVGRFAWIFYYVMNIVAFYYLWSIYKSKKNLLTQSVIVLAFFCMAVNVYFHNYNFEKQINFKIPALADKNNDHEMNRWIKQIDFQKYQAILPLPYYHIGSESSWHGIYANTVNFVYVATVKSGLPTFGVHLSRTSITQTYKSLALSYEPYRPYEIIKDIKDNRPILVLAQKDKVTATEKPLFSKCKFILENEYFQLYELSLKDLIDLGEKPFDEILKMHRLSNPTLKCFYESYDTRKSSKTYKGKGAFNCNSNGKYIVFEHKNFSDLEPYSQGDTMTLSFWFADIQKDLFARTHFTIDYIKGDSLAAAGGDNIARYIKTIDSSWVLVEYPIVMPAKGTTVRMSFENFVKNDTLCLDELLIYPANSVLRFKKNWKVVSDGHVFLNNRYYPLDLSE